MRNSSDEIYINGEYYKNNPTWGVADSKWKAGIIYELIKKHQLPKANVAEVGCGAGIVLKELSQKDSGMLSLKGYDISPQAIAMAKTLENGRLSFYNQNFSESDPSKADLLLMIDVVEHVDDIYSFLRNLKPHSTYFIFHIPLDLCCRTILKPHVLLQQRQSVGHIHYFTREMVCWILKDTGYEIIDWHYTKPIIDTHPPDSTKRRIKKVLRNLSFSANKHLSATLWGGYSMMILAK